jgi:uncharacterized protein YbbK (DUF523 family)
MSSSFVSTEDSTINVERFTKVERITQDATRCYREKYEEKKKQTVRTKLSMFLVKKKSPTSTQEHDPDDPQPSTSND